MPLSDYDYTFKVLLIGNSGVGKSSLLGRFTDGGFSPNLAKTIGVDFKTKTVKVDRTRVKLQIWDTAGQERFRTITSSFYRGAVGVILVYDLTDNGSFQGVMKWIENLKQEFIDTELPAVFLGANKADLEGDRQVQSRDGRRLASQHGFSFVEISARSGVNVDSLFVKLAASILRDKCLLSRSSTQDMLSETVNIGALSYDTHSSMFEQNRSQRCCSTS